VGQATSQSLIWTYYQGMVKVMARANRLSRRKRVRLLAVLDALARRPRTRPVRDVDAELRAVRAARRRAGRRSQLPLT
jgi:hypothetical protein